MPILSSCRPGSYQLEGWGGTAGSSGSLELTGWPRPGVLFPVSLVMQMQGDQGLSWGRLPGMMASIVPRNLAGVAPTGRGGGCK